MITQLVFSDNVADMPELHSFTEKFYGTNDTLSALAALSDIHKHLTSEKKCLHADLVSDIIDPFPSWKRRTA